MHVNAQMQAILEYINGFALMGTSALIGHALKEFLGHRPLSNT